MTPTIEFIFQTSDPINPEDRDQVDAAEAREKIARARAADFAAPNPEIAEAMEFARWHSVNADRRHFNWSALAYDLRRRYGDDGRALFDAGLEDYPAPGRATYRDETWENALRRPDGEKPHRYHPAPRPHYCDESLVTRMRAWRKDQEVAKRVDRIKAAALAQAQFAEDVKSGKIPVPMQNPQVPTTPAPIVKSAADLQHKMFAPVQYVVPGYIAEGCTILAGKPKVGKSWIMLDVGLAVASGGQTLGTTAQQGDVLCLMLEDNERRLKDRIKKIVGPFAAWPQRFTFATEWPRSDEGLAAIRAWLKTAQAPRLIVVDVLARFRAPVGSQNAYEADYAAIAGLQAIASEYRIAVVVIHHLRKSAADSDPFDKVSGTLGLSGAADSVLILDRDGQGTTLYGRGRDIEEIETAVEFDRATCRWRVLGAAPDVRRSDERKQIIDALKEAGGSMTRSEIIAATGMQPNAADQLLYKMGRAGEVRKVGRGVYHVVTGPSQRIIPPPPC